jgi:hypothetical protein
MLHLAKTSGLGIDPEENARSITASVGEPWADWGQVLSCHSASQAALSASDTRSSRFARSSDRHARAVAGDASTRLCRLMTSHWTWAHC